MRNISSCLSIWGWCGFGNELYALREVKVRITQTGGKMKEFTLIQEKNSKIETDGDAPFYQWGRKDPILPSDGTTKNHDKTYYTDNAQYAFANDLSTSDIKENIKNPHKFNVNNIMDNKYHNLWNADNEKLDANDDAVIKTVYDPSPVGYTVPAPNAFTGITTTGDNEGFGVLLTPAKTNAEGRSIKGGTSTQNRISKALRCSFLLAAFAATVPATCAEFLWAATIGWLVRSFPA